MRRFANLILVTLSFALPVVAANYASNWASVALGSTAEKFGFDGYRDTAYAHFQELHSSHAELAETAKVVISEPGSVLKAAYTGIKETGQGLLRLEPRAVADVEAFKTEVILDMLIEGPGAFKNMIDDVARRSVKQGLKLSDDVFEASLRRLNEALESAKKASSLRQKYELARQAGFTKHEVRALMDMGIICFSGDTRVHTPMGMIAIADLQEDDQVYSQSTDGTLEAHAIRQTFTTHPDEVFAIRYRDGAGAEHELHGTANHPFYVVEKSAYVAIEDVVPGAHFLTANGENVFYLGMEPIRGPPANGWTTYNIEVPPHHNYYVQEAQAPANSPSILVHNFGGEKCTPVQGTGIASGKLADSRVGIGETKTGLARTTAQWRNRYGPSGMRDHHLVPQALLNDRRFTGRLSELEIDDAQAFIDKRIARITQAKHAEIHD